LSEDQMRLAQELRVKDRIVQLVRPEVEIIEALYNRAVALLFPSRYEGFGWPPIEAQACGCPVVASDIPPILESLRQSAVINPLLDEDGMAEAIVRLATNREYREEVRQRGFENVRSRFQTSRMMGEYIALYREVACQD
jgi:glycosyltransferase involved in cell wall biosynthesis